MPLTREDVRYRCKEQFARLHRWQSFIGADAMELLAAIKTLIDTEDDAADHLALILQQMKENGP